VIPGYLFGPHQFAITATTSTIDLSIDSKSVSSASRGDFFPRDDAVYLKVAAEAYAVGDSISGLVDRIILVNGARVEKPPISDAAFDDRGLNFACKAGGEWVATGRFDPTLNFTQYVPPRCN
jgi:hypothetical protein